MSMNPKEYKASAEEIKEAFKKAQERLSAAYILIGGKHYFDSVSRSYYAILDSARALLLSDGHFAKTHDGVLTLFNLKYVKTGKIEEKYKDIFEQCKKFRIEADYHFMKKWDYKTALKVYKWAKEFVRVIKLEVKKREKRIQKNGYVMMKTILL